MSDRVRVTYFITLSGYFSLFILMMLWLTILEPPEKLPISLALIFMVGPLMLPLRGLLHGRAYTFAWSGFVALLYLLHGMYRTYFDEGLPILPILEIIFSLEFFLGAVYYARWKSIEVKGEGWSSKL